MSADLLGDPDDGLANLRIDAAGEMQVTAIGAVIMAVVEARRSGVEESPLAPMLRAAQAHGFTRRAEVTTLVDYGGPLNAEVPEVLVELAGAVYASVIRGMAQ